MREKQNREKMRKRETKWERWTERERKVNTIMKEKERESVRRIVMI